MDLKVLETAYSKIEVPAFDANHFNYNEEVDYSFLHNGIAMEVK